VFGLFRIGEMPYDLERRRRLRSVRFDALEHLDRSRLA